jgi:CheY-like chemotaxis protein
MPTPSSVILHVENDTDDIFMTQRALKKVGVTSPTPAVENGEQAVSYLLGQGKFDNRQDYPLPSVILLDWNMPLMSGSEFLQWLRSQTGALRRLPVIGDRPHFVQQHRRYAPGLRAWRQRLPGEAGHSGSFSGHGARLCRILAGLESQ